jgi:hypothetical protein
MHLSIVYLVGQWDPPFSFALVSPLQISVTARLKIEDNTGAVAGCIEVPLKIES